MSFLRSKSINHFQIILPRQNSYRIIAQLGRLGSIEFKGTQLFPSQMPYYFQVKICEELLSKIELIQRQLLLQGHGVLKDNYSRQQYNVFLEMMDRKYRLSDRSYIHLLQKMSQQLQEIWRSREHLKQRMQYLLEQFQTLKEQMNIFEGGKLLFGNRLFENESFDQDQLRQVGFKCGVMMKKDQLIIKRTVFRISRGLSVFHTLDQSVFGNQKDQKDIQKQRKVIFFLFFGFGTSSIVQRKIQRTLDIYCLKTFDYPKSDSQLENRLRVIKISMVENQKLQELVDIQAKSIYQVYLQTVPSEYKIKFSRLEYDKLFFLGQKLVYEKVNQMKMQHSFSQAEIFVQSEMINEITTQLQEMLTDDRMPLPQFLPISGAPKPTLFELNEITSSPYQILKAYGVPQYQQINPAVFNLITFPFLFGVMFSDIAHGLILFGCGLFMIIAPNKAAQNPLFKVLLPHRIMIVLMGFFSTYCGFIYNQFLSMDINFFGSCYQISNNSAIYQQGCIYPFGLDPIWSISQNQLQFTNSLKMKIAVIIAVVHMTLGICLKAFNQLYKQKKRYILFETIPQLIFFVLLFGYMDFLIVYKWLHQWTTQSAPSIITTMINIPLKIGKTQSCCGGQPMWGIDYLDTSQNTLQIIILVVSLICLPMILCLKPIQIYCQSRRRVKNEALVDLQSDIKASKLWVNKSVNENLLQEDLNEGKIEMSEVVVHQIIQTIEFALGCISNTASYLRLWALSLAHQQLSQVFFEETVRRGLEPGGFSGIPLNLILFPVFAIITFAILLCMDSMECFLHTLRLHWVEFQNKFYKGDGVEFMPFDLRKISNEWIQINAIAD